MKIKVDAKEFVTKVAMLRGVVPARSAMPVLKGILIKSTDETIAMEASNTEMSMSVSMVGEVETQGSVVIAGKKLLDVCGKLSVDKDDTISLTVMGTTMKLEFKRSCFTFSLEDVDQFPDFLEIPQDSVPMNADDLVSLFNHVVFATSRNLSLRFLCGVHLVGDGEALEAVALDKSFFARATVSAECEFEAVIIPTNAVTVIMRTLRGMSDVWLATDKSQLACGGEDVVIAVRLIDFSSYPDYEGMISNSLDGTTTCICDRILLSDAVERILVMEQTGFVRIDLESTEDNMLALGGTQALDIIECDFDGVMEKRGTNGVHLRRALSHIDTENIVIHYGKFDAPIVITPEDSGDREYVICAMQTQ